MDSKLKEINELQRKIKFNQKKLKILDEIGLNIFDILHPKKINILDHKEKVHIKKLKTYLDDFYNKKKELIEFEKLELIKANDSFKKMILKEDILSKVENIKNNLKQAIEDVNSALGVETIDFFSSSSIASMASFVSSSTANSSIIALKDSLNGFSDLINNIKNVYGNYTKNDFGLNNLKEIDYIFTDIVDFGGIDFFSLLQLGNLSDIQKELKKIENNLYVLFEFIESKGENLDNIRKDINLIILEQVKKYNIFNLEDEKYLISNDYFIHYGDYYHMNIDGIPEKITKKEYYKNIKV